MRYRAVHSQQLRENERERRSRQATRAGGETPRPRWASAMIAPALSAGLNQSQEDNPLLSYRHLHRPNTDMEFRDSFARLKKKVKHLLTKRKPKPNKIGTDVSGESVNSTGSHSGSEPHVVEGGSYDQEGEESSTDRG